MNGCIPNWKMEDESRTFPDLLSATYEKRYIGSDNELLELLWRNGQLIFHNQTNCRAPTISESKQAQGPESLLKNGTFLGNPSNFIQEDETSSWFQSPLDGCIEKELSEFFCGTSTAEPIGTQFNPNKDNITCAKQSRPHLQDNVMLPPKPLTLVSSKQNPGGEDNGSVEKFSSLRKTKRADMGSENRKFCDEAYRSGTVVGVGESSSMRTTLPSVCDSNINNVRGVKDSLLISPRTGFQSNTSETLIASSSGIQSTASHGQKRKGIIAEESEGHSEETGYESAEANKTAQRPASGRRSRAAEVHNLSERRRRDRINEKLRALQDLIPHCNKTDKASMLDEAIEYLKSLQLQLQIMWMGNGMAPLLFSNLQGMGQHSTPSNQNPVQLPIFQADNQSMPSSSIPNQPHVCPIQHPSSVNVPNQAQNCHLPEPYSCYFSFPQMQVPQVMNMCTNGPQIMQQNLMAAATEKQQHACIKSSIGQSENQKQKREHGIF